MVAMDDTPMDRMLSDLAAADPAEAPAIVDQLTDALSEELEAGEGDHAAPEA